MRNAPAQQAGTLARRDRGSGDQDRDAPVQRPSGKAAVTPPEILAGKNNIAADRGNSIAVNWPIGGFVLIIHARLEYAQ
jgi:hypothetical protein